MTDGYSAIIDPQVSVRRGRLTRRLRRRLRIQWSRPAHLSNPISQALTTAQVWLQGTPQVPELFPQLQAPVESGVCTRTDSRQQKHCQQQRDEVPPAAEVAKRQGPCPAGDAVVMTDIGPNGDELAPFDHQDVIIGQVDEPRRPFDVTQAFAQCDVLPTELRWQEPNQHHQRLHRPLDAVALDKVINEHDDYNYKYHTVSAARLAPVPRSYQENRNDEGDNHSQQCGEEILPSHRRVRPWTGWTRRAGAVNCLQKGA